MLRSWICALVVALAPGFGRAQEAGLERFEAARAEAAAALVEELVALADWSEERKLFAARERCLNEVLRLAPDDERARAALGHKRQRDGSWRAPERRHAPKDHAPQERAEFDRRHARVTWGYCEAVLAAMAAAEPPLPRRRADELREELLAIAPEDARARAAFGEVRQEDAWVLAETVAARAGRAALKELVRAAYEAAEPAREVAPSEAERALGLALTAVLEVPGMRVLGTVPREELETFARVAQAARTTFCGLLGVEVDYGVGATAWLLAGEGDKARFLEAYPGLDEGARAFLAQLEGSGLPGTVELVHWAKEPRQRLDGALRIALGWLLYQQSGLTPETGWVYEGLGLYLTRELIGTRLTWFVKSSEYLAPNLELVLRRRLMRDDSNWMNEANLVLQGERPPKLQFVTGKTVNTMTPEDMLFAYVTVAYLLESRPADARALFERIGAPVASAQAVEEELGLEVLELDRRVRRWLTERR